MNFRKSIAEFGAKPSLDVLQTAPIQAALDACHSAGGGEFIVPAGSYLTDSIRLYSNTCLHLLEDAVFTGSQNPKDYTDFGVKTSSGYLYAQEYVKLWHFPPHYANALVTAADAQNISIPATTCP